MINVQSRLPKTLWRVLAVGGQRHYWEGGSRQYTSEQWAHDQANVYRRKGAIEVHIFRADLNWVEVTDEG